MDRKVQVTQQAKYLGHRVSETVHRKMDFMFHSSNLIPVANLMDILNYQVIFKFVKQ